LNIKKTMKLLNASAKLSLLTLAVIASAPAVADHDSGWYLGGSLGQSRAGIDNDRIASGLLSAGFNTTSISNDNRDLGYKFLAGYQFNRNIALEGGYFDLGEFGFTAETQPPGSLTGDVTLRGLNVDLIGMLPIDGRFSAFARIGANHTEAKSHFSGTGAVSVPDPDRKKRATKHKVGLGLQYSFSPSWALRAEAERYRIDDSVGNDGDIDLISLGLVYRFFGDHAPETAAPVPAPAAALPRPLPIVAPAVVVVPGPAKTVEYCSILDIQFEIDADTIQREEQEKLAVVATFLKKYPDTTALIEGHTDNVGDAGYNRQLSQRRADSVVDYLVATFDIARSRLKAVGYGDTRPIADNATQEGQRLNRRIGAVIACASDIEGLAVIPARITMAMEMEFDRDQTNVKPQYRAELAKVAKFLNANPAVTATVEGHTANLQPSEKVAMDISQRRAQSVVNYLVNEFGIARSRLKAEGFGETRRFAYNTSVEGREANRRVNIIINYPKK
jgi:OmpA-OmpF porin, OOP family